MSDRPETVPNEHELSRYAQTEKENPSASRTSQEYNNKKKDFVCFYRIL